VYACDWLSCVCVYESECMRVIGYRVCVCVCVCA